MKPRSCSPQWTLWRARPSSRAGARPSLANWAVVCLCLIPALALVVSAQQSPSPWTYPPAPVPGEPEPTMTPAVQALMDEGVKLRRARKRDEANQMFERALALARISHDLVGEAFALQSTGPRPQADQLATYREIARLWQEVGYPPRQAEALVSQGLALIKENPQEAHELFAQALRLAQSDEAHPWAAAYALYFGASRIFQRRSDLGAAVTEARPLFEAAIALRQKFPDTVEFAEAYFDAGRFEQFLGNVPVADEYTRRAKVVARVVNEHIRDDDPKAAENLGLLLRVVPDFATQMAIQRHRLAIEEKRAPQSKETGEVLMELALTAVTLNDDVAAQDYTLRALAVYEKLDHSSEKVSETLNFLGILAYRREDLVTAEGYLQRALAIEEAQRPTGWAIRMILGNLAVGVAQRGDFDKAEELYRHANNDAGLASLFHDRGEMDKATPLYEKELERIRARKQSPGSGDAGELWGIAHHLAEIGKNDEALDLALSAQDAVIDETRLVSRTLDEPEALQYATSQWAQWKRPLDVALTMVFDGRISDRSSLRRVLDSVIRSRALVFDETAARHRSAVRNPDPEVALLLAQLAVARQRLAALVLRNPGGDLQRHQDAVARARNERQEVERTLAARSEVFRRAEQRGSSGLDAVATALPKESSLVGFVRFEHHNLSTRRTRGEHHWYSTPYYLAFVLRPGQEPVAVPLGPAEQIERLVGQVREQIALAADAPSRARTRRERAYRLRATELRRRVWDPVQPRLAGSKRVFLVLDGSLHVINFAALPTGQDAYLVESSPVLHYLSTERDLVVPPRRGADRGRLLALGAPDFDSEQAATRQPAVSALPAADTVFRGSRSVCGDFQQLRFDPLPASAAEISDVTAAWSREASSPSRRPRSASAPERELVLLRGREATKIAFAENATGARVIHVATHGFFLGERCSPKQEPSRTTLQSNLPAPAGGNPLLDSGLAFAGANRRHEPGSDDDGILTAEEIASLDLEAAEWVVLSGCDTGLGTIHAGEGVFGLRRAFQIAGARTVIMSLWPVEDMAARIWMRALYRYRWVRQVSTGDAVRDASLQVLRSRRARKLSTHPFYWAAFIAAGMGPD